MGDYGSGRQELDTNQWIDEFQQVKEGQNVEDVISYDTIAAAMAAYQKSQAFVATPWRAYVQGDDGAID